MKVQTILGEIEVESEVTKDNLPKKGDTVLRVRQDGDLFVINIRYNWTADRLTYPRKNYIVHRAPRLIRFEHKLPNGQVLVIEGPEVDIPAGAKYDLFTSDGDISILNSWVFSVTHQKGNESFAFPSGSWRIVEVRDA